MQLNESLEFGYFFKTSRLERSLTQEYISYQSGVSRSTISHLENGKGENVQFETIIRLLAVLNMNISINQGN